MRIIDKVALFALVIFAILSKVLSDTDNEVRRPNPNIFNPPNSEKFAKPELPPAYANAPTFDVKIDMKNFSSTGTAFSVGDGIWVTARHVTTGCDIIILNTEIGKGLPVSQLTQERNADISIFRTKLAAPALPVSADGLRIGQMGWSFGYPRGKPGDVFGKIIGRAKMRAYGRYSTIEPVIAFTQIRRIPDAGTDLGGISGGPWVDREGRVIGVHVAGAPRRGRSFSTDPSTLLAALSKAGISSSSRKFKQLTDQNFSHAGNFLRKQLTIAKVMCLVGNRWKKMTKR